MQITNLPNYKLSSTIHEGADSITYYAVKNQDNQKFVIKLLQKDYPTPRQLARYQQEFEILQSLDSESVIKAYQLEKYQNTLFLLLEDFGGQSLSQLMRTAYTQGGLKGLSVSEFLPLAIKMAHALGEVHAANIIHKDITPSNIAWNPQTQQLKIIDFGIASFLPRENPSLKSPEQLEGTLAYLSPEQTGRINRAIDYRSDLYALGVCFYELLTGQLPFSSRDAMELVHAHIAEIPVPVHELNCNVPPILSKMVMKLLAKNAEDRYQSAFGVEADLIKCLESDGTQAFILGQNDFSGRFQIPQKLYGREAEIDTLLQSFDRITQGSCEMVLVAGYSGTGKTALVHEVYKPMTEKHGYFAAGKFDQLQRNIPYSGLFQALNSLCDYLLSESSEQIEHWRQTILQAVGENGKVLIDVIPKLELIIGEQAEVAEVEALDMKNRFNMVFQAFFKAISQADHPLILFLDDLQWADTPSLNLLNTLMTDSGSRYFLIIGAYRDNEVDEAHPLTALANSLNKAHAALSIVQLPNLTLDEVNMLVAESLTVSASVVQPLSKLVYDKTQGNAFFVHEFLKHLVQEQFLCFEQQQRAWQWDVGKIATLNITENVTELMVGKISQLSTQTQNVLKLAACIGNCFELKLLSLICQQSQADTLDHLWPAIEEGLINPIDDTYKQVEQQGDNGEINPFFNFQHDRVQQAAYSLIADADKPYFHYQIGNLLLADPDNIENKLFEMMDHLNAGLDFLTEQVERDRVALLNLQAGQKAKAAIAYSAALSYFHAGIDLIAEDSWQTQYDLTLCLYQEASSTSSLTGDFTQMELWADQVLEQAHTTLDKVKVYEAKIQAYAGQNKLLESIATSLEILHLLGCDLPEKPNLKDIQHGFDETMALLPQSDLQQLTQLPIMTDETALAIMRIIASVIPSTFQAFPNLFPFMVYQEVQLSIKHGNSPFAACAYGDFAILLIGLFHDAELSYQFGKIASTLVKLLDAKETKAQTLFKTTAFTFYSKHHVIKTLPLFQKVYQAGMDVGNLEHAAFAVSFQCIYGFFANMKLKEVEQMMVTNTKRISHIKQESQLYFLQIYHQLVVNLVEETETPWILTGSIANETQLLNMLRTANAQIGLFLLFLGKLILAYLFKNMEEALEASKQARRYLNSGRGFLVEPIFYFYESLSYLANYHNFSLPEQASSLQKVEENQAILQHWLPHADINFRHKYDLVEAERLRVIDHTVEAMERYEEAITGAERNVYLQNEALAYELAAEFYLARGMDKFARLYFREAYFRYEQWGAKAKLKQLSEAHSQLLAGQIGASFNTSRTLSGTLAGSTFIGSPMSSTDAPNALDLSTVMKAARTISSEIVLDKLLEYMMRIVVENAGAQRGLLILKQDKRWLIQAKLESNPELIQVLGNIPLEEAGGHSEMPELSVSIVNYVIRTHNSVVLNDAVHEGLFTQSAYIAKRQPKSILCIPLINQGRFSGILYLENNLVIGAFTADRLEILSLLSSQMAVSIENAVLYNNLEQQVATRTQELDKALNSLWSEMELAKQIQTCLLPKQPTLAGYDIAASCEPFSEVGGDYYDVISADGHNWIVIGDVSGHGVTSGLVMMMVQTAIHTVITNNPTASPSYVLAAINGIIYNNIIKMDESKHMTIVLLAEGEKGQFSFAGLHEDILLFRAATGEVEQIETNGFWVGVETDIAYLLSDNALSLEPQDCLVLYTDGITEARKRNKQGFFGLEQLVEQLETTGHQTAAEIHAGILETLKNYQTFDDVTLMVVKRAMSLS